MRMTTLSLAALAAVSLAACQPADKTADEAPAAADAATVTSAMAPADGAMAPAAPTTGSMAPADGSMTTPAAPDGSMAPGSTPPTMPPETGTTSPPAQ